MFDCACLDSTWVMVIKSENANATSTATSALQWQTSCSVHGVCALERCSFFVDDDLTTLTCTELKHAQF